MQNRRIYGKIGSEIPEIPEIPGQNKETDTVISSEKALYWHIVYKMRGKLHYEYNHRKCRCSCSRSRSCRL